ncbi:hypothetical protein CVIRNUC_003830 [Coccomyxa viridis]|uniref:Small ribosomal subunit protein bS18c n=1 Tax=Coccomyxa viridis TaxID=1274662 RepID=A0AAV1I2D9_9CHLO|nr:hypothetical protein CVIRNUC_003830 [Coccomyxa viridis]
MRLFLRHAGVLKQVSASTVVLKRLPFVSSGHWLHVSVARSASGDDGSQSADDGEGAASERAKGLNRLPENATATEMREWADRMLRRSAADARPGEASASAANSGVEQNMEADAAREEQHYAKVQVAREQQAEDDAFQEEQSFDRDRRASPDSADGELGASLEATADSSGEADTITQAADNFGISDEIDGEYKTTAAVARTVQDMPGVMDVQSRAARREGAQVAAEMVEGAEEDAHKEQKWQSFMQKHFGSEIAAAPGNPPSVPKASDAQSRIFDMKDPRQELNNLLPEEFRRFDVRDRSYIRAQPNYVSEQMLRTPPPKRVTVKEELVDQKADPVTGYARLGYVGQDKETREEMPNRFMGRPEYLEKMRKISAQLRLHPTRSFFPGQTYNPEELAADSAAPSVAWSPPAARAQRTKKASNAVVRAQADFRNQPFLNAFVSELGKLPPKRTTGLQQKTHRHLCRQIKLARQMALLPVDSRLTAQYLAKATGRDKAPATTEDNPVLSHLLPPCQREVLPRDRFSGQRA